eukprot:CAMPEP_0114344556 /NCGR_PEP_ID=MMETSP0101-20121206/11515_1 /TAXON_ID=38822 ORGANISM="Pteridomonas danica, Strain PT" /NCGR_SAMPLE_ID=MMETSP0101 /ASSEMBLY_ACC=CAM_ASM_000211 /LENGTH=143 /DNA_ID=CAMNT_0001479977 /DNA_START=765 /DNA_END=1196 /DNA_ORIENTATION=+
MIDRSPCGTGTCAVMTSLWAKGKLDIGERFVHEGILGTSFIGCLEKEVSLKATQCYLTNSEKDSENNEDSQEKKRKKVEELPSTSTSTSPSTSTSCMYSEGEEIRAVIPTISGQAWITQHCQIVIDPSDPFQEGYTVGDIWAS